MCIPLQPRTILKILFFYAILISQNVIGNKMSHFAPTPKRFKTQSAMYNAWDRYMKHTQENHMKGNIVITENSKDTTTTTTLKPAIYTLTGFYKFIGVRNLYSYENNSKYEDAWIYIKACISDYKLSGAYAGIFSSALAVRDLGLVDKSSNEESKSVSGNLKVEFISKSGK